MPWHLHQWDAGSIALHPPSAKEHWAEVLTSPFRLATQTWAEVLTSFPLGYSNLISSPGSSQLGRRETGTACTCSLPTGNRLSLSLLLWARCSVSRTWLRGSSWGCAQKLHPAKHTVFAPGTAQAQPGRNALLLLPTIFRKKFKQWEMQSRCEKQLMIKWFRFLLPWADRDAWLIFFAPAMCLDNWSVNLAQLFREFYKRDPETLKLMKWHSKDTSKRLIISLQVLMLNPSLLTSFPVQKGNIKVQVRNTFRQIFFCRQCWRYQPP